MCRSPIRLPASDDEILSSLSEGSLKLHENPFNYKISISATLCAKRVKHLRRRRRLVSRNEEVSWLKNFRKTCYIFLSGRIGKVILWLWNFSLWIMSQDRVTHTTRLRPNKSDTSLLSRKARVCSATDSSQASRGTRRRRTFSRIHFISKDFRLTFAYKRRERERVATRRLRFSIDKAAPWNRRKFLRQLIGKNNVRLTALVFFFRWVSPFTWNSSLRVISLFPISNSCWHVNCSSWKITLHSFLNAFHRLIALPISLVEWLFHSQFHSTTNERRFMYHNKQSSRFRVTVKMNLVLNIFDQRNCDRWKAKREKLCLCRAWREMILNEMNKLSRR